MKSIALNCGLNLYVIEGEDEQEALEQIQDPNAFVITSEGCYAYKKNRLYKSLSKIDKIGMLGKVKTFAEFKASKLPLDMFRGIRSFFGEIYELHKSEVAILLYYNLSTKKWLWTIPKQEVSSAAVSYDESNGMIIVDETGNKIDDIPDGFIKLGSIHSHAAMSAFHSGVDDKDEYNFDGLHITIGNFNLADCTYSVRWIISGHEIKSDIKEAVCGLETGNYPQEAVEQVSKKTYISTVTTHNQSWKGGSHTTTPASKPKTHVVAHGVHTSGGDDAKKKPESVGVKLVK